MDHSFSKGLRIIEELASADEPLTLTELAKRCGLAKSNAHKFLKTLIDHRYVRQPRERGPYELTLKIWELGTKIVGRSNLAAVALEPMHELSTATKETVSLVILDEGEAVYIAKVDGTSDVRAHTAVGRRRPLHCVAAGKALLAFQPDAVIADACRRLERFTAATITDPVKLRAQLAQIRKQGYAVNRGEWTPAVRGLSAPVRDAGGSVVAAVNISVPSERLTTQAVQRLAPSVIGCAAEISRKLGYAVRASSA